MALIWGCPVLLNLALDLRPLLSKLLKQSDSPICVFKTGVSEKIYSPFLIVAYSHIIYLRYSSSAWAFFSSFNLIGDLANWVKITK